jgi:cytochrome c553
LYLAAVSLVVVSGLLAADGTATASNEIAEREDLVCTTCHDKPGSKLLTDQGKYYELMRSLDGYDEVTQVFGECTTCHVRKPGSVKLTQTGRLFQRLVDDMAGLRTYLREQHPTADAPEESPGAGRN